MPEVQSAPLLEVTALTGTPTAKYSLTGHNSAQFYAVSLANVSTFAIFAKAGTGGTALTFTVEGTTDPRGESGWAALACRPSGGGAYAATARTAPTTGLSLFFDPTDNVHWVRLNVTTNDTVGPLVQLIAEV